MVFFTGAPIALPHSKRMLKPWIMCAGNMVNELRVMGLWPPGRVNQERKEEVNETSSAKVHQCIMDAFIALALVWTFGSTSLRECWRTEILE